MKQSPNATKQELPIDQGNIPRYFKIQKKYKKNNNRNNRRSLETNKLLRQHEKNYEAQPSQQPT